MPRRVLFRSGHLNRARSRASQSSSAVAPPRSTLAEQVYQQLRRDIIHGVFQAGEAINEKVLAKRYQGQLQGDADQFIRFIVESAARMEKLIHDLLDFSRVDARATDSFMRTSCDEVLNDASPFLCSNNGKLHIFEVTNPLSDFI